MITNILIPKLTQIKLALKYETYFNTFNCKLNKILLMTEADILDQMFDQGYVTKKISLANGKVNAQLQNLRVSDQLSIEKDMHEVQGSSIYTMHTYSVRLLSTVLKKWNGQDLDKNKAKELIDGLPSKMLDKLIAEHQAFEKQIGDALEIDQIKQNFSPGAGRQQNSEQQSEE